MIQVMVHVLRFLGRFLGGICSLKMKQGGVGSPACGGCICALARGVGPPPDPVEFIYIHFSPFISFPPSLHQYLPNTH